MLEIKCPNCESGIVSLTAYQNYYGDMTVSYLRKSFIDFDVDTTCECKYDTFDYEEFYQYIKAYN